MSNATIVSRSGKETCLKCGSRGRKRTRRFQLATQTCRGGLDLSRSRIGPSVGADVKTKSSIDSVRNRERGQSIGRRRGRRRSLTTTMASIWTGGETWILLAATGAVSEFLSKDGPELLRKISAPLIALVIAGSLRSLKIGFPAESAAYSACWGVIAPIAIVLSLQSTNLKHLWLKTSSTEEGRPAESNAISPVVITIAFLVGAVGTVIGTVISYVVFQAFLGDSEGWKIAACLCASYIGGTANFAAVGTSLSVQPAQIAGALAADNMFMALVFGALLSVKETDRPAEANVIENNQGSSGSTSTLDASEKKRTLPVLSESGDAIQSALPRTDRTLLIFVCAFSCLILGSNFQIMIEALTKIHLPGMDLAFSCILACASGILLPWSDKDRQFMSFSCSTLMLLFFAAAGAVADVGEAIQSGFALAGFVGLLLGIHLFVLWLIGRKVLKLPIRALLIASNANIGGPATAMAFCVARGWKEDSPLAAATGTLGYAIATGIGITVGQFLSTM